jgi:hypothetical protein
MFYKHWTTEIQPEAAKRITRKSNEDNNLKRTSSLTNAEGNNILMLI